VAFGAPLQELTVEDLASDELVFQIGVAPNRIDLRASISGVTFQQAWRGRAILEIGALQVPVIGRGDLIRNKQAAGRPRDLADLADLEGRG